MSSPLPNEPIILLDPHPRRIDRIFDEPTQRRLEKLGRVIWHDGSPASTEHLDQDLPPTVALIGQSPLDKARLDRAPRLRAVFNVESNFLSNLDDAKCDRRGIPGLSTAPVHARPVAKLALAVRIKNVHWKLKDILPRDWDAVTRSAGLGDASTLIAEVIAQTPKAIKSVNRELPRGFPARVSDKILSGIEAQAARLSGA